MRKIVFFDIDGTLCDDNMEIPASTVEAVKQLQANGHLAFLCSGRARGNIRNKKLLAMGFDGVVAACGNYVEMDGKVLKNDVLDAELVAKIIYLCRTHRMPIVLEGAEKHWLDANGFEHDPYVDYLIEDLQDCAIMLPHELEECLDDGYVRDIAINKFSADIMEYTNFEEIRKELSPHFEILIHTGDVVEFVPKGTSKATGIAWLCDHLGIDKAHTFGIGDSINDLDMLQFVGHGIAMGNATQPAKDAAEYITTDIHEDGIYNALGHYGLI